MIKQSRLLYWYFSKNSMRESVCTKFPLNTDDPEVTISDQMVLTCDMKCLPTASRSCCFEEFGPTSTFGTNPCNNTMLVPGDQQINKNWNRIPPWEFFSYDHHVGPYSATAKMIRITDFQAIPGTNHQSTRNWSLHQFCSKNLLQLLILLQFCFMAKLPKTEVCSNFQRPKSALHNLDMLIQDILKAGRWP